MAKLTLLLAFHNHQPDGNFDHVFHLGHDVCYRPLLDLLGEFPRVRCALHHTGPLLEWLEKNRPQYMTDLRALVERGQIEVLGGGFYEPMLAVLPREDAIGQLGMMNDYCASRFGQRPRGMWLAERVWEPALAELINAGGNTFTLIDDTHFRYAGISGDLQGYYVTEKAGSPLAIFPIEKELRYAIPFLAADKTIGVLDGLLARGKGADVVVTYGDDGEKFGMWPGTKEWVWEKGWLREFFQRLTDASDRIVTSTFSDVMDQTPPTGRVYLPTASYEEMGEWTLPAEAQERYLHVRHRLEHENRFEEVRPFFRGGVWQGFLSKYAEANFMHKKMVHVSRKVNAALAAQPASVELAEARRELYRAQCNCAYWHGLFGGLYLNYLRHAVYAHLIGAETVADRALGTLSEGTTRIEKVDFDADLRGELILSNSDVWVGLKPDAGGAFFELDARAKRFNLGNVLGRHPEGYHGKLREAARKEREGGGDGAGVKSIHDIARVKESGLEELLHYDRHLRLGFVDHFMPPGTTLLDFSRSTYDERGDFATGAYTVVDSRPGAEAVVTMRRAGKVRDTQGRPRDLTVDKIVSLAGRKLSVRWRLTLAHDDKGPLEALFSSEVGLTLLAGDDAERRYELPGRELPAAERKLASRGITDGERLDLVDDWSQLRLILQADKAAGFFRFPLETASQSEDGFERTYQGSVIAPFWPLTLSPGDSVTFAASLNVTELVRA
jgi:4-alpha-glucanotransferase